MSSEGITKKRTIVFDDEPVSTQIKTKDTLESIPINTFPQKKQETQGNVTPASSLVSTPNVEVKDKDEEPVSKITDLFEIDSLPSMYKSYPKGVSITYHTYSILEIRDLSGNLSDVNKFELMLRGIVCKGMSNRDLTFFDFIFICLMRRLLSLRANKFSIPYFCPKCHNTGQHFFELSDLVYDELKVPALPANINFHSLGRMSFKPLTIGNYLWLNKNDLYYRKDLVNNDYMYNENVEKIINYLALN